MVVEEERRVTEDHAFAFEGGGAIYLIPRTADNKVRPYVAGYVGWGALAWAWTDPVDITDTIGNTKTIDSDSNGFIYFAPEAGIELLLNESVSIVGGVRYLVTKYGDETNEGLDFSDADGGDFVDVYLGLSFTL